MHCIPHGGHIARHFWSRYSVQCFWREAPAPLFADVYPLSLPQELFPFAKTFLPTPGSTGGFFYLPCDRNTAPRQTLPRRLYNRIKYFLLTIPTSRTAASARSASRRPVFCAYKEARFWLAHGTHLFRFLVYHQRDRQPVHPFRRRIRINAAPPGKRSLSSVKRQPVLPAHLSSVKTLDSPFIGFLTTLIR